MFEDLVGQQLDIMGQQAFAGGQIIPPNFMMQNGYVPSQDAVAMQPAFAYPVQAYRQDLTSLVQRQPTCLTTEWYGLPRTKVCKGEVVEIEVTAQIWMKPVRIYIDPGTAYSLLIHDITIAKDHLVNGSPISASIFTNDATDVFNAQLPTVQPGCTLKFVVQNIGDIDLDVTISLLARLAWGGRNGG